MIQQKPTDPQVTVKVKTSTDAEQPKTDKAAIANHDDVLVKEKKEKTTKDKENDTDKKYVESKVENEDKLTSSVPEDNPEKSKKAKKSTNSKSERKEKKHKKSKKKHKHKHRNGSESND
jgi:hypothetical protein